MDQGWIVNGNAVAGTWERGDTMPTFWNDTMVNPGHDVVFDLGNEAYVTGIHGRGLSDDDVDVGFTMLSSPPMDLGTMHDSRMEFSHWYFSRLGETPSDDTLYVSLYDHRGRIEIIIDQIDMETPDWKQSGPYYLKSYGIDLTELSVRFLIADSRDFGHITEAGIDAFSIRDTVQLTPANEPDIDNADLNIFPNPASDFLFIRLVLDYDDLYIRIYNSKGELTDENNLTGPVYQLDHLPQGAYTIQVTDGSNFQAVKKLFIHRE